jgi:hypothetical protein
MVSCYMGFLLCGGYLLLSAEPYLQLVIIVDLLTVLACRVKISLVLPVISYFVPVGYEQNVEEHVASKYCCTWRGFNNCINGRANGPCCIVKEDIDVIGGYCLGHVEFSCA